MRIWRPWSDALRRGRLCFVQTLQEWRGLRRMLSGAYHLPVSISIYFPFSFDPSIRPYTSCQIKSQVRCNNRRYCSREGVTVVITDHGASDNADFILSQHAFVKLGRSARDGAALLALGVVDVDYRRY